MIAQEIMTSRPTVVAATAPIQRAAQLMVQLDVGALPVVDNVENNRLVGVITDRDIVTRHVASGASPDCCVGDHMTTRELRVVHPDADVRDVMGRMRHDQVRRIIVVDDEKHVVGIIAQADIARQVGPRDAGSVGEVLEEISTPHAIQVHAPV